MTVKSGDNQIHLRLWLFCAVFCAGCGVFFCVSGDGIAALVCFGTVFLTALPYALHRFAGMKLHIGFYIFCLLYAMGPMLGKAFRLYYTTIWWDKLLHTSGGVVFAAFGAHLVRLMNGKKETSPLLQAIFGLCFSIALSAVWELYEYGVDCLFAADMQHDTVVHAINTHFLSDVPGGIHTIRDIQNVSVNGVPLAVDGYLDIGLHDTMQDMIVETCGAAVYMVWHILSKDRHRLLSQG